MSCSSSSYGCGPCDGAGTGKDWVTRECIAAALNRFICSFISCRRRKVSKYEDFKCLVRFLSRRSVDPRGGYAAFLGLRDNDPSKVAAIYIDNIRGEFDPNLNRHKVYHVAMTMYGDTNAIPRSLNQPLYAISANTVPLTGKSYADGMISEKVYYSPNGSYKDGYIAPNGLNNGFNPPGVGPAPLGSAEDIAANDAFAVGFGP